MPTLFLGWYYRNAMWIREGISKNTESPRSARFLKRGSKIIRHSWEHRRRSRQFTEGKKLLLGQRDALGAAKLFQIRKRLAMKTARPPSFKIKLCETFIHTWSICKSNPWDLFWFNNLIKCLWNRISFASC